MFALREKNRIDLLTIFHRTEVTKHFLTIALPTTSTRKESYLLQTLDSVILGLPDKVGNEVQIVILNADCSKKESNEIRHVRTKFSSLLQNHTLRIIHRADTDITTSNDSYLEWRAKQCLDYAYLMSSCIRSSEYYLHLEDDVICASNYYEKIKAFISKSKDTQWSSIRFCDLGFIGILFKTTDLHKMIALCKAYHDELPVDWLLDAYQLMKLRAGKQALSYSESLFQHIGYHSSLAGKVQKLKADSFQMSFGKRIIYKLINPLTFQKRP